MKIIWLLCLLAGCSGYRFTQQDNPLSQYGIETLSVPMFYNYSNLPAVSAEFTRETYRLLTGFSGLKLINGYKPSADAVMIGIIKTPEKIAETLRPLNLRVAQDRAKESIGPGRGKFYIPGTTDVSLYLQIIVIKKPSAEELALLQSGIGEQVHKNSRVIFNELIPLKYTYTREILDGAGTQVIATQNQGVQRKSIKELSMQAATSVRDVILYAF
jgi:hypothetical protein